MPAAAGMFTWAALSVMQQVMGAQLHADGVNSACGQGTQGAPENGEELCNCGVAQTMGCADALVDVDVDVLVIHCVAP